ncbi:MAG: hypothetical protein R3D84_08060 [Paracoccaceae bacterium]
MARMSAAGAGITKACRIARASSRLARRLPCSSRDQPVMVVAVSAGRGGVEENLEESDLEKVRAAYDMGNALVRVVEDRREDVGDGADVLSAKHRCRAVECCQPSLGDCVWAGMLRAGIRECTEISVECPDGLAEIQPQRAVLSGSHRPVAAGPGVGRLGHRNAFLGAERAARMSARCNGRDRSGHGP